jgi:REP element-mobilizing transposase RayT
VLLDARIRDAMIEALPVAAGIAGCQLMAWCLMPDHVHALLRLGPDGGDILRFLHSYKSWTGRIMTEAGLPGTWERSFWDRHSRNSDDVSTLVRYALCNPVRAGLCDTWEEWPYSEYLPQIGDGRTAGRHGS